jgi:hypothetical protein
VFFLLFALWMEELAVIGVWSAALIGGAALATAALLLYGYARELSASSDAGAALAALRRVSAGRRGAVPRTVRTIPAHR